MKQKKQRSRKSATKLIEAAKKQVAADLVKPAKVKVTNAEAKERTDKVTRLFQEMGSMWWELGAAVRQCIDDRVPEALGKSAHEWMNECFGDSWLKVYRAHRIMKALSGVDMEKLQKISEGNAYALARLPEKVRKSADWIKKAAELPNEKFKESVDKLISKKTGVKDPMVKFPEAFGFATLPKSLAKIIEQALKLASRVNDFDWDQKDGRISCTEDVFSSYILTYQDYPAGGKARNAEIVEEAGEELSEELSEEADLG